MENGFFLRCSLGLLLVGDDRVTATRVALETGKNNNWGIDDISSDRAVLLENGYKDLRCKRLLLFICLCTLEVITTIYQVSLENSALQYIILSTEISLLLKHDLLLFIVIIYVCYSIFVPRELKYISGGRVKWLR